MQGMMCERDRPRRSGSSEDKGASGSNDGRLEMEKGRGSKDLSPKDSGMPSERLGAGEAVIRAVQGGQVSTCFMEDGKVRFLPREGRGFRDLLENALGEITLKVLGHD